MYNIAVIGDKASVFGFAAIGIDTFCVDDSQTALKTLRRLINGNYAVIYITEKLAFELESEIDKYSENYLPAIILIPGVSGNTGAGINSVKKSVEQAVGSDIIFNK